MCVAQKVKNHDKRMKVLQKSMSAKYKEYFLALTVGCKVLYRGLPKKIYKQNSAINYQKWVEAGKSDI